MTDRGQYGFDFLAGMSVFLITIGFIFGFAPGMFSPFTSDTGPNMIVADRSAASLSEQLLVESTAAPGRLNESCTETFFDADGQSGCHFDADADDLHAALGIEAAVRLNVTIEDNGTIVDDGGVPLAAGPAPDPSSGVTVSQRIVFLYDQEQTLYVRVW